MKITPRSEALDVQNPMDPAGGQLLHVIHGEGWVQARGHAPQRINEGDTVTADPGEEHWHGAGKTAPMAHIAVAVGETRWLEESPSPPH